MNKEIEYQKILIPVDFSDCSRKAFYVGVKYSRVFDADAVVLHVGNLAGGIDAIAGSAEDLERLEEGVRRRLDEMWEKGGIAEVDRRRVTVEIRGGKPWVEIVKYAEEHGVDLIVMGTHGAPGIRQMLIGSQAERVVRRAPCHVLTIKPDDFDPSLGA